MTCQMCLKEKEIFVSELCLECSEKMDEHISGYRDTEDDNEL